MAFQRYSRMEPIVFVWVIIPYITFMNLLMYGSCVFNSVAIFAKSFVASAAYFFLIYGVFGYVAVIIKNRYPGPGDLFRRIRLMLPFFYLMNVGAVTGAFYVFAFLIHPGCDPIQPMVGWTILYACGMSTVITFINEGMANWEKWKNSLSESEKLQNAYERSKLLGLKGQINPHFLFNCFNTLSGLIHENEEKAESFLDEMTKVNRYLLRSGDEYLVSLSEEIKFANSYLYLNKARFGSAIETTIDLPGEVMNRRIAPLSMQVILENIIYTNALSKKAPLKIHITSDHQGNLIIRHSLHEKIIVQNLNVDEGLDNLIVKYRLLNMGEILVKETVDQREFTLPLFETEKEYA